MLSADHKADLLRRAGIALSAAPAADGVPVDPEAATASPGPVDLARAQWERHVDALFVAHALHRALQSLRQEERRLRDALADELPLGRRQDTYDMER